MRGNNRRKPRDEALAQRGIKLVELPSTSPANARMRLDDLVLAYRAANVFAD